MRLIADLHIHSKYSRATSKQMDISHIAEFAKYKGIDIVGTGDFTHPLWLTNLKKELKEDGSGFLTFQKEKVRFVLTAEISGIFKQGGKTRKIHTLLIVPDLLTAEKIHNQLAKLGANLHSDGRPIIGLSAKDLAQIVFDINPKSLVIPAHAWTPWFSIFGSKSGFDSINECYEELSNNIYAIETGLSSDPQMNWRLSSLDNITLISNSDAHSPQNLGREANFFKLKTLAYQDMAEAIKTKNNKQLLYTIEFYPEEGMYHFDGHRNCKFVVNPFEKQYHNDLCPICHKPLTIGVANRIGKLADRTEGKKLLNFPDFKKIVPLREIIAESFEVGKQSKRVEAEYFNIVQNIAPEFEILLELSTQELYKQLQPEIAKAIIQVRQGNMFIEPGYDGVYGKVKIFDHKNASTQGSLF